MEDLLQDAALGTFVVRKSSRPGHFALSLRIGLRKIANMLIIPSMTSDGPRYRLGTKAKETFSSVKKLVDHYLANGIAASEVGVGNYCFQLCGLTGVVLLDVLSSD